MRTHSVPSNVKGKLQFQLCCAATFSLLALPGLQVLAQETVTLSPVQNGKIFGLQWTGTSNTIYRVQSTTSLSPGTAWTTEDLVSSSISGPLRWMAPESLQQAKFYRLALPEPEIIDVQPSVVVEGVPVEVYIIGQGFGSNDVLKLGPLALTNRIVVSPTLIQVAITPPTPGVYNFELDSAATGQTSIYSASLTIVAQAPIGTHHTLFAEPPSLPWGAPTALALKQKNIEHAVGEMRERQIHPAKIEIPNLKVFSGEIEDCAIDLHLAGRGLDCIFGRSYRSRTGTNTIMGNGWDFSYNIRVQPLGGDVIVHDGMGRDDTYFAQSNGTYVADGFLREGTISNNVFRLTFADTGFWEFNVFDGTATAGKIARSVDRNGNQLTFGYDLGGRLVTIIDDLGRTNTLGYNALGYLASITDFSGRTVSYAYYRGGTPGGSPGDLASVTSPTVTGTPNGNDFPTGKTTRFTYTTGFADDELNHNLASITDGLGQTWLQVVYRTNSNPADLDYDAVDYVQRGAYRTKLRRVAQAASPANHYATVKAILNDPVGNVTECFYDSRNRCVRQLAYTGRANPDLATTETDNRPQNKLRSTDPDFFETLWEWNPDSLCTREVQPGGEVTEILYERAFNQNSSRTNRRLAGNLRVAHDFACCSGADTDGDGVPDLTLRSWYLDYLPGFGSVERIKVKFPWLPGGADEAARIRPRGWDGTIKGRFARGPRQTTSLDGSFGPSGNLRKGWDGTIKGNYFTDSPDLAETKWEDDVIDFATRVTDPQRTIITASYDTKGNRVITHVMGHLMDGSDSPFTGYAYNLFGQIVAMTNASDANGYRRVDAFTYYTNGPQNGYCFTWTIDTQAPTVTLTTYEHDPRGNITRCVDPRGNDRLYVYNELDQCVRYQGPTNLTARCTTDFYFDANDNLVQKTADVLDQTDKKYSTKSDVWSFDALDRCTAHIEQVSDSHFITNGLAYDGNNNVTTVSSPEAMNGNDPTNILTYTYDERDLPFQSTHAPALSNACTTECAYDLNGRPLVIKVIRDEFGNESVRLFTYDGFGRCVTTTDAMGNVCTRAYDANDNLVYLRRDGETNDVAGGALNQRLVECRYDYDSLNRCTRTHYSFFDIFTELSLSDGEATTSYSYAPNGECLGITDDNNHKTRYTFDTVGRLSLIIDPKTNLVSYTYDTCGNPLSVTRTETPDLGGAAQSFVTYNVYDNLSRCTASSDNVGNTNRYSYDSLGRCVRGVDARGNLSGRSFDHLGRCTVVVADLDGDGKLDLTKDAGTTWTWDDNSRCVAVTDANSNTVSYAYDSVDRCVQVTNPDTTSSKLIWSPRSNLVGEQDANGTVISNSFDLLDRCVRRDITPAAGVAATTTFEVFGYDGCSRLVMASNDTGRATFAYDSMGDCVASTQDGLSSSRVYDGVGNRLSMTYPGGRLVSYAYDALNQVTSFATPLANGQAPVTVSSYAYDGPGRLSRLAHANTVNTRVVWDGLASPPNSAGDFGWRQVSGVNHQIAGGGNTIDRRGYLFDRSQNKVTRAQLVPWLQGGATETNIFGYDAIDRLRSAANTKGSASHRNDYALDAQGNRVAVTNDGSVGIYTRDATLPEPADFQMDQYSSTPFAALQYDHNGNLVSRATAAGPIMYHYDYADRLVEVDGTSGPAIVPIATFTYDALGRRTSKTDYPPPPLAPVTTAYKYDCDDNDPTVYPGVLEERQSGALSRVYCWGGNGARLADLDRDGMPDVVAFNGAGQAQYYHCDELGNVLALTDAKGAVLERYAYDDYGQPTFLSSDGVPLVDGSGLPVTVSPQGNPLLFHGMQWDGETGLYLKEAHTAKEQLEKNPRNRVSSYDPSMGRYLLRAGVPLRFDGGNAYTFANDNPWSYGGGGGGGGGGAGGCGGSVALRVLPTVNKLELTPDMGNAGRFQHRQEFGQTQATRRRSYTGGRFGIEVDGKMVAGVHSIEGLEHEHEIVEYKDGEDGTTYTRPGNHKPGKMIVTKDWSNTPEWYAKDWSNTSEWYKWRKAAFDGKVERKSISVIFHNDAGEEAGRMNFYECWPTKWKGPALNAKNSGHAIEKLEIIWETMELK